MPHLNKTKTAVLLLLGFSVISPAFADQIQQITTCTLNPNDHLYVVMNDGIMAAENKLLRLNTISTFASFGIFISIVVIGILLRVLGIKPKYHDAKSYFILTLMIFLFGGSSYQLLTGTHKKAEVKSLIQKYENYQTTLKEPSLDIVNMCEARQSRNKRIVKIEVNDNIEQSTFITEPLRP